MNAKQKTMRAALIQVLEQQKILGRQKEDDGAFCIAHGLSGKVFRLADYDSIPELVDNLLKQPTI
jgi:hypothetical protein